MNRQVKGQQTADSGSIECDGTTIWKRNCVIVSQKIIKDRKMNSLRYCDEELYRIKVNL